MAPLVAAIAFSQGQWVEFKSLPEGLLQERLRLAHPKTQERFQRLGALFEQTGCPDLREQKVSGSREPNLICIVAGNTPNTTRIVVGAHYDSAGGDGVIDNWTGAILLPSLAEFMRAKPRRHSFHFVGFAAEERGLWGSKEYLSSMKKAERTSIAAVITMDSLGLSATKCWPNSSSKQLMKMGAHVALAMRLGFAGVNVDAVGNTDSTVFHRAGIPVLSLHSLTQDTWQIINSRRDVWDSLSWKDYYDTHRFVSALLVYLDEQLP
ncbi:MAG: M28 family peptidase [Acidobacteria bacterium]|nr:M28 family peptidase [Acidobacteriota bacterium]